MGKYNELARVIHDNAVEHGWWDAERSVGEIFALIHMELSEALKEYLNGKGRKQRGIYFSCNEDDLPCAEGSCEEFRCDATCEIGMLSSKPQGFEIELADVVIRILDFCRKAQVDIDCEVELAGGILGGGGESREEELPELVALCHSAISQAFMNASLCQINFAACIYFIDSWVAKNGGNLERAIALKHEYNKTRPHLNGAKA